MKTLSRGIRLLEVLADAGRELSIEEVAHRLGTHRSVAYRLMRTLEAHRLVRRPTSGSMTLGPGLKALAAGIARDLQRVALPQMAAAADTLGMTCLLVVRDADEAVTVLVAAPRGKVAVSSHAGRRHPLTSGAPGTAILSALPPKARPTDVPAARETEIAAAARRGYAVSHDETYGGVRVRRGAACRSWASDRVPGGCGSRAAYVGDRCRGPPAARSRTHRRRARLTRDRHRAPAAMSPVVHGAVQEPGVGKVGLGVRVLPRLVQVKRPGSDGGSQTSEG